MVLFSMLDLHIASSFSAYAYMMPSFQVPTHIGQAALSLSCSSVKFFLHSLRLERITVRKNQFRRDQRSQILGNLNTFCPNRRISLCY